MASVMEFKDHFSSRSSGYRRYRPGYPRSLFAYLADQSPARSLAWDCATGTGQVARGIAPYFSVVLATDASVAQLHQAMVHPRVAYRVAPAEMPPLPKRSVNLVTVAQALHWFDTSAFFDAVTTVLSPGGLVAVWSYNLLRVNEVIDDIVQELYGGVLADHWPAERRLVETGYAGVDFPFEPLATPDFAMIANWRVSDLLGYLRTWSAVDRYQRIRGSDPVQPLEPAIVSAWGSREYRQISWPLSVRMGRPSA